MTLAPDAQASLDRIFTGHCDPAADAFALSSAVYWGLQMDGPVQAGSRRFAALVAAVAPGVATREAGVAYLADLRAFSVARHAPTWGWLAQMFGSRDAVNDKLDVYLADLAQAVAIAVPALLSGTIRPLDGNALGDWGQALSVYCRFWVDGREGGIPADDLMRALWTAPERPGPG